MKAAIRLTGGDLKTALLRALSARLARRSGQPREGAGLMAEAGRRGAAVEETTEGESHGKSGE
nr:hypothetical protein [Rhizobium sp. ACO-34A]